jgi:putative GTP pyrophosphokinase
LASFSKSQIDRLGERLKKGSPSDADLRLLDEYRRSFGPAYDFVIRTIRDRLQLEPTGRLAKSTSSITEKLRRESIRLSQVQDIAGCRVVVTGIIAQDQTIAKLRETFPGAKIVDRREHPTHGYRAVHVIIETKEVQVEIQVRSSLQHLWAELSERLSDVVDSTIKYGGGEQQVREHLSLTSGQIAKIEEFEKELNASSGERPSEQSSEMQWFQDIISHMKNEMAAAFRDYIANLEGSKR